MHIIVFFVPILEVKQLFQKNKSKLKELSE